tara:strand:+ start:496 stop:1188 length:693 start_codon:yes stop_codon:yes gene_type:complete
MNQPPEIVLGIEEADYLTSWLEEGGALGVYGRIGGGGGSWLAPALHLAGQRRMVVKVLDLVQPARCRGISSDLVRAMQGHDVTWTFAENVALKMRAVLAEPNTVLCIRNLSAGFLAPAAMAGAQVNALVSLFSEARAAGFPICAAMPSVYGYEDLLRAFRWIWCYGFDAGETAAKEVEIFARAARLVQPDALWRTPPISQRQALVVQLGETRRHLRREMIDVSGIGREAA